MYLLLQAVPPKAGTPVVVQESQPAGPPAGSNAGGGGQAQPPGGMFMTLLPFLILVPFLFMMFRRQKKEQAARASLKKGDRVASQSGLVGELVELDERFAKVKIAPGLTVQMVASSINALPPEPEKKDDLKGLKEATAADKKR